MTKEDALEQNARALTEGLADPWRPKGCIVCLHGFFRIWTADWDESLALLRRKFYLWHTMVVFLTTKRTEAERDQLSKWMMATICEIHRREGTFPKALHHVAAHTIACQLSLYVTGVAMEELADDSASPPTLWPRKRADYFPLGPKVTVESILDWFCGEREYQQHGQLLAVMIQISRQRVLPVLMRDSNRDRLMMQLLRMLSGANVPSDGDGYTRDSIMRFHHNDVRGAACILHAVMRGHRYSLCDEQRLTRGYENALSLAVLGTVRMLDGWPEQPHLLDLLLALHFRGKLPRAALPGLAIHRKPEYIADFCLENEKTMRAGGPFAVLLRYLRRMWVRMDCLAPDCGRHSHESTTGHTFPLCARCQFAMYCSRACQKRDWERPGAPHREICDILREVFTFSWMDMDEALFVDACLENNFPVSRAIRLTDWIASVPYRSCI